MSEPSESSDPRGLVSRLWSYCELLRHSGVSTLDYVEQLTYLLFLKMADERANRRLNPERIVPDELGWPSLVNKAADALHDQYEYILAELGQNPGMLGAIFSEAKNKIQEPAVLERLVKDLINQHRWSSEDADVKGDAYEGLLQRGAEDRKTGAGQYFTPRAVIDAMVDCVPARSKGQRVRSGVRDRWLPYRRAALYRAELRRYAGRRSAAGAEHRSYPRCRAGPGDRAARFDEHLAARHWTGEWQRLIEVRDSLAKTPSTTADVVLANPPFGVGR